VRLLSLPKGDLIECVVGESYYIYGCRPSRCSRVGGLGVENQEEGDAWADCIGLDRKDGGILAARRGTEGRIRLVDAERRGCIVLPLCVHAM
jgi:hypothetical protein